MILQFFFLRKLKSTFTALVGFQMYLFQPCVRVRSRFICKLGMKPHFHFFFHHQLVDRNFIWEKLMEFLLFNEVLKNLIFFWSPVKKVASMTLILSKFQSLNVVFPDEVLSLSLSLSLVNINFEENHSGQLIAKDLNLWSTLLFARFEKLNFFNFWGPQKSPNFGFLTFEYAFKN